MNIILHFTNEEFIRLINKKKNKKIENLLKEARASAKQYLLNEW